VAGWGSAAAGSGWAAQAAAGSEEVAGSGLAAVGLGLEAEAAMDLVVAVKN